MRHVTHMNEWGMSRMRRVWMRRVIWMRHVTHELCHTCEWGVTHMNFACHTYNRVMSHLLTGEFHVLRPHLLTYYSRTDSRINEAYHTSEWVMSHSWMRRFTHKIESCLTYEWVTSHIWMSHVSLVDESWPTYKRVMSHLWMNVSCHLENKNLEFCNTLQHNVPHAATHCNTL